MTCSIPSCPNQAKRVHKGQPLCDPHYWEAHAEMCECPPGWRHDPDCPMVIGDEAA